jgi:HEPN domain-containing protein
MPPMHVGAFMFRDVFFPIRIPVIYGLASINLIDFLNDVPEITKRWLLSDNDSSLTYFDQVIDLMDFVYGIDDLEKVGKLPAKTLEWWNLAKIQLEAAAATVLGSFNKYAVIQNCCISVELILKGALRAKGIDETTLKDSNKGYGHNLEKLVEKAAQELPSLDREAMLFVVEQLPSYVKTRYETESFSRLDLGEFLMNTQFIGGEILRQFSDRNSRADFRATSNDTLNLTHRTFPKNKVI